MTMNDPETMSDRSLGQLFSQLTTDLSVLVRDEIELAKVELKADMRAVGKSGGLLGGAAFAGYLTVVLLSFALAWGLAELMPAGLAFLIVGVLWAVVGAVAYTAGRKQMAGTSLKPEQTVETLKEDVAWAKHLKR